MINYYNLLSNIQFHMSQCDIVYVNNNNNNNNNNSNSNWTVWSTIQGVIMQLISKSAKHAAQG